MVLKLFIKPTSGGEKISVEVEKSTTVAELKEAIGTTASIPAAEQRLIYKGQVLKDERTVESYGELLAQEPLREDPRALSAPPYSSIQSNSKIQKLEGMKRFYNLYLVQELRRSMCYT